MGGGYYDGDVGERTRSTTREHFNFRGHVGGDTDPTRREVHPKLNPKGVIRECCDSREHPNSSPIVVVMDDTRSRGKDAKVIFNKLPMFIGEAIMRGYVADPTISFAAVGDMTAGDQAPLQVGQFESDNRLDEMLSWIWLEEGGGGTGQESYELAAYFYARKTKLDCLKRGKKGYLFFLGDEGFYPKISASQIQQLIGDDLKEDLPSAQIFAELQKKFNVFFIYPQKSWQERKADIDAEIQKRVEAAGGQYKDVDIRASLIWNNHNDLDLHVIDPCGHHIFYGTYCRSNGRDAAPCGGFLDVDMNVHGETTKPVENIRWKKGSAPKGRYRVYVQNYAFHEQSQAGTSFRVELEVNGKIEHFEGKTTAQKSGSASDMTIFEFNYDPNERPADEAQTDLYAGYRDEVIERQWAGVLPPENILKIEDPNGIVDVMLGAIALTENRIDLPQYLGHMGERGQTALRRSQTAKALTGLAESKAVAALDTGRLPRGTGTSRRGKSSRL